MTPDEQAVRKLFDAVEAKLSTWSGVLHLKGLFDDAKVASETAATVSYLGEQFTAALAQPSEPTMLAAAIEARGELLRQQRGGDPDREAHCASAVAGIDAALSGEIHAMEDGECVGIYAGDLRRVASWARRANPDAMLVVAQPSDEVRHLAMRLRSHTPSYDECDAAADMLERLAS